MRPKAQIERALETRQQSLDRMLDELCMCETWLGYETLLLRHRTILLPCWPGSVQAINKRPAVPIPNVG